MVIENGGDHKECGVHAFSSLIHLFRKWRSLDHLCLAHKRLVCWSKFSDLLFLFLQSCDDVMVRISTSQGTYIKFFITANMI